MSLLPRTYDMITELDKLENLMPTYAEPLRLLSKTIRNNVWQFSDENNLAKMLNVCNWMLSMCIEAIGESISILEMYIDLLDKKSTKYSTKKLTIVYDTVRAHVAIYKTGDIIREHWRQMNPYFKKEYAKEDFYTKDLIEILDDLYNNIIEICPEDFFVPLGDFTNLLRGRRNEWTRVSDLLPPTIEVAIEKNIINRWNPPSKRYLYIVAGTNEEVCLEEMRISYGEKVTIADFEICDSAKGKMAINLDYDNILRQDVFDYVNEAQKNHVNEIIDRIIDNKIKPSPENIKHQITLQTEKTRRLACSFAGKLLFKEICDAIFVPLDNDEDTSSELKDMCYKSFHILAEYFEGKNLAGIIYPSTRMKLIHKKGTNLVLFNVDDARPIIETYRPVTK